MTTAKELRKFCDKLRNKHEEDLKSVLNDYFEFAFILCGKPWRAVIGNKRCKPIPIHRDIYFSTDEPTILFPDFKWPNGLTEEVIKKELTNLGFVVTGPLIAVCVPPCEKGKKLSFAQEWVKKINYSYSVYCKKEKELAKNLYPEFISELLSSPTEKIKVCDNYTLFCEFTFTHKISSICHNTILSLMKVDGIEEFFENGEYKGIKVLHQPPN